MEFLVEIPVIEVLTSKPCRFCNGGGKDKIRYNEKCISCDGTGKEKEIKWDRAYEISATFNLFTLFVNYPKFETSSSKKQLLIFNIATSREMHGGSISGQYSIPLTNWLKSFGLHHPFPEINDVLKKTWARMFNKLRYFEADDLKAYIGMTKGFFIMDVPGDATGIHGTDHYENEGNKFSCHNVDTPMQQLALIAGLAKLHDIARNQMQ